MVDFDASIGPAESGFEEDEEELCIEYFKCIKSYFTFLPLFFMAAIASLSTTLIHLLTEGVFVNSIIVYAASAAASLTGYILSRILRKCSACFEMYIVFDQGEYAEPLD